MLNFVIFQKTLYRPMCCAVKNRLCEALKLNKIFNAFSINWNLPLELTCCFKISFVIKSVSCNKQHIKNENPLEMRI